MDIIPFSFLHRQAAREDEQYWGRAASFPIPVSRHGLGVQSKMLEDYSRLLMRSLGPTNLHFGELLVCGFSITLPKLPLSTGWDGDRGVEGWEWEDTGTVCFRLCFAAKEPQRPRAKPGSEGSTSSPQQDYVILFQQFRASGLCVLARSCRTPVLGLSAQPRFPRGLGVSTALEGFLYLISSE